MPEAQHFRTSEEAEARKLWVTLFTTFLSMGGRVRTVLGNLVRGL